MNLSALYSISYGLYVITSRDENRLNGQIANTVFQISNDPPTLAVSINKQNLTHTVIGNSRRFVVSVLSRETPLSVIGQFGFNSGRDKDKFAGLNYRTTPRGLPYLIEHVLAWIEVELTREMDAGTHTIFVGEVTGAEVIGPGEPMTYAYYHQVKKGHTPPSAPTHLETKKETGAGTYVCTVCGYEYDPATGDPDNGIEPGTAFADLPDQWTCPLCGVGKDKFEQAG